MSKKLIKSDFFIWSLDWEIVIMQELNTGEDLQIDVGIDENGEFTKEKY